MRCLCARGNAPIAGSPLAHTPEEIEVFIDNLLVRILFIIVMIRWTSLASWEFEFHPQIRWGLLEMPLRSGECSHGWFAFGAYTCDRLRVGWVSRGENML